MCSLPPLRLKSFCVRTQIAKTEYLPAEYIPPTFLTRYPLPLLRRLTMGAAIEKNFFYFFKTLLQLVKFSLGIPYHLLSFLVLYLSDFDLEFISYR